MIIIVGEDGIKSQERPHYLTTSPRALYKRGTATINAFTVYSL